MMAATRRSARPFAPLVLDDASSLEAIAGAVMRLHSALLTIGRCYTTVAADDRATLELGRIESVLADAFCTIFGQSPADRFTDIFDQVAYVAEHMVKDHIFEDGQQTHQPYLCVVRPKVRRHSGRAVRQPRTQRQPVLRLDPGPRCQTPHARRSSQRAEVPLHRELRRRFARIKSKRPTRRFSIDWTPHGDPQHPVQ